MVYVHTMESYAAIGTMSWCNLLQTGGNWKMCSEKLSRRTSTGLSNLSLVYGIIAKRNVVKGQCLGHP